MRNKWHVELKGDLCVITRDDGKVQKEIPRSMLKQQMEPYGVVGDLYDDLCDQLDGRGRATVVAA
jgi:hypothetical protein